MKKRLFALLAALICLLCGCSDLPESSDPVSDPPTVSDQPHEGLQTMALAYSHDDTLNPFAAATAVNAQLTGLLYDSLVTQDVHFSAQLSMSEKATLTDPTHAVLQLRSGMVFSDGSAVTVADVVTSFNEAKKSPRYRELLSNVSSAKGDNKKGTVTFTLASADPQWLACFTFPIVKGSTLTTAAGTAPLGGGAYVLQAADGGHRLVANSRYSSKPHYETVSLQHLPNHSARHYALASGDIAYYFNDLSDGDLPSIVGANKAVPMNAMVYIGINSARAALSKDTVRQALSALTDRAAVCHTAYADWAVPATATPFHPQWSGRVAEETVPARDIDGATALLETAGYPVKNGKRIELELIYSTDRADRARVADAIRIQMEDAGVAIIPVPLSEAEYRARLTAGNYDLYIAEIHLTADMSLRPLLAGGAASYGISHSGAATAYGQYLSGAATLEQLLTAFAEDMPYIPLCWRSGLAAYDRRLTTVTPTGQDPYSGFADWQ